MTSDHGRTVVVTGGSNGIGRATVERFADDGHRVVIFDIDVESGEALARKLRSSGAAAEFAQVDVTDETSVGAGFGALADTPIDTLINNAGVNTYFDAAAMSVADWDRVFALDLRAAWLCSRSVLPGMRQRRSGSIVNIASIHAKVTQRGMFPYAAAKSGLVGLTRSLALDEAPYGIRVNAVSPGWTRTRLVEEWFASQPDPAEAERSVLEAHPLGRIATTAEIAAVIAFVASPEASFITGADIGVDGGLSVRFAE